MPLFQSESWSIVLHMKMSFHSRADKTHFHMKSFARSLTLKKRHKTICLFPVVSESSSKCSRELVLYQCMCYTSARAIPVHVLYQCMCYTSTSAIPLHVLYQCMCYTSARAIPVQLLLSNKKLGQLPVLIDPSNVMNV